MTNYHIGSNRPKMAPDRTTSA